MTSDEINKMNSESSGEQKPPLGGGLEGLPKPADIGLPWISEEVRSLEDRVRDMLKTCYDPEIPVNIYELGLIYEVKVNEGNDVYVKMSLTSPACPVAESLPIEVEQ